MKASSILICLFMLMAFSLSACQKHTEAHHEEPHKIVATNPCAKEVTITQEYVCQIHSQRNIEVRALERGYLEAIAVKEGQAVKQGDVMFKIVPILYQAKLDTEVAEAELARIEFNNTKKLFDDHVVAKPEVALAQAKLAKAEAQVTLARAELNFTDVKAPFDGIIDRLHEQQGSLIEEGDILTTLSDNDVMWVYFNVPEARYLEYMTNLKQEQGRSQDRKVDDDDGDDDDDDDDAEKDDDDAKEVDDDDDQDEKEVDQGHGQEIRQIELVLANGKTFPYSGEIGAIEAQFNNETGNIPFRADFPNPDGLLRHGQTGNVLIHRKLKDALVIPQRATFETLDKRYVFVIDKDGIVHQREIVIQNEMEDVFVVARGLEVNDKFVVDGVRQVRDGEKVEYTFHQPEELLASLKTHAE